jgi:hypothetical protein
MEGKFLKKIISMITAVLLLAMFVPSTPFTATPTEAVTTGNMWGKVEIKKGVIGKLTVDKPVTLFTKDKKGKLLKNKTLGKGAEIAVYSYDSKTTYYKVEGGFVKKSSSIKYLPLPKNWSATPTTNQSKVTKVAMVTDVGGVDDRSYNQSAWEGIQAFGKANKMVQGMNGYTYLQPTHYNDYLAKLELLVSNKMDLIFNGR